MQILHLVPLLSSSVLDVTLVGSHLQRVVRSLTSDFGGTFVRDVGD